MRSVVSSRALRMMIPRDRSPASARQSSHPSMRGIIRSSTTRCGLNSSTTRSPALPSAAARTSKPSCRSPRATKSVMLCSSSTTRMRVAAIIESSIWVANCRLAHAHRVLSRLSGMLRRRLRARLDWPVVGEAIRRVRRPGPMVVIAVVYLIAASGIMIWRGISVSPDYILLLCVPVALLSGHVFGFLRDWIPFVAIFLGYEALRGIAPKLGIPPHVSDVAGIETAIFGGHVPSAVLQAATPVALGRVLAYGATVVYFCHFVFPFGVALVLWLANRTQFLRYTTALMGMSFFAFVLFLLVPTAPPWYAENH